MISGYLSSANW